ncbi:hypothetical protein BJ742DRAFT_851365 [Cladochytrium replicatum]|nr:hypothetical protein BJ742DRAFT_851365 [Cladochytrium replicatum]
MYDHASAVIAHASKRHDVLGFDELEDGRNWSKVSWSSSRHHRKGEDDPEKYRRDKHMPARLADLKDGRGHKQGSQKIQKSLLIASIFIGCITECFTFATSLPHTWFE